MASGIFPAHEKPGGGSGVLNRRTSLRFGEKTSTTKPMIGSKREWTPIGNPKAESVKSGESAVKLPGNEPRMTRITRIKP
jgi:hypothetical protein